MKVSLLLTTYNRPEFLRLVLHGVLNQTRLPDEILIGDDGSTGETRLVINQFKAMTDIPVIHVWQEDMGFRKTRIMNKALAKATGDYVVQIDGDIIMHHRLIADHLLLAKPGHFIRGNRVRLKESFTHQLTAINTCPRCIFWWDTGLLRGREKAFRLPGSIGKVLSYYGDNPGWVQGCNFSFWLEDAKAINGYDEMYEGWGEEDQDFASRLQRYGCRGIRPFRLCITYHLYHPEEDKRFQPKLHSYYKEQCEKEL